MKNFVYGTQIVNYGTQIVSIVRTLKNNYQLRCVTTIAFREIAYRFFVDINDELINTQIIYERISHIIETEGI